MAINKNAKTFDENVLVYGIDKKSAVILPYVNLDNEGKEKLGLKTFDNEPEYVKDKKTDEGDEYKTATIELYIKIINSSLEETNGKVFPIRFYIDSLLRPESKNTGKIEYINKKGQSAWLESKDDEVKWLDDKVGLRRTYKGETSFMKVLDELFGYRNMFEAFNWKKVFNGDFSDIKKDIKDAVTFIKSELKNNGKDSNKDFPKFDVFYYVKEKEIADKETGETRVIYRQEIYNGSFKEKNIRKDLKYKDEAGYPLKGYYKTDGILMNVLRKFDIAEFKNDVTNDESDMMEDDLPF